MTSCSTLLALVTLDVAIAKIALKAREANSSVDRHAYLVTSAARSWLSAPTRQSALVNIEASVPRQCGSKTYSLNTALC